MSRSPSLTEPRVGGSRPPIRPSSVDLPQPLGPMIATLLPGSTWFGVPPGTTGVEFDAQRTDTTAVLSAAWRDAWI